MEAWRHASLGHPFKIACREIEKEKVCKRRRGREKWKVSEKESENDREPGKRGERGERERETVRERDSQKDGETA
jgi:hypothetical protein